MISNLDTQQYFIKMLNNVNELRFCARAQNPGMVCIALFFMVFPFKTFSNSFYGI